jgi:transposase-like protein
VIVVAHFGPLKIEMYLRRYHDVQIGHSTIYRILKRLGMSRLPASQRYKRREQRWKRYEKQRPGHQLQIDVKFVEPLTDQPGRCKRYYEYTAIDDCTRLRILRMYPKSDQKTAIQFLDYVLSRLPFQVEKIQTDNGAEFQSALHWHALDKGISHRLHPAGDPAALRESRALSPHRRRANTSVTASLDGEPSLSARLMRPGYSAAAASQSPRTAAARPGSALVADVVKSVRCLCSASSPGSAAS